MRYMYTEFLLAYYHSCENGISKPEKNAKISPSELVETTFVIGDNKHIGYTFNDLEIPNWDPIYNHGST